MLLAFVTLSANITLSEYQFLRHATPQNVTMQSLRFGLALATLLIAAWGYLHNATLSSGLAGVLI